jgi:hypothetical protein
MVVRKPRIGIMVVVAPAGAQGNRSGVEIGGDDVGFHRRYCRKKMAPRSRYAGTGARAGLGRVQPALLEHASPTRGTGRRFQRESERPSQLGDRRFTRPEFAHVSMRVQIRGETHAETRVSATVRAYPGLLGHRSIISTAAYTAPLDALRSCSGRWCDFSLGGAFGSREPRPAPCGRRRLKKGA